MTVTQDRRRVYDLLVRMKPAAHEGRAEEVDSLNGEYSIVQVRADPDIKDPWFSAADVVRNGYVGAVHPMVPGLGKKMLEHADKSLEELSEP